MYRWSVFVLLDHFPVGLLPTTSFWSWQESLQSKVVHDNLIFTYYLINQNSEADINLDRCTIQVEPEQSSNTLVLELTQFHALVWQLSAIWELKSGPLHQYSLIIIVCATTSSQPSAEPSPTRLTATAPTSSVETKTPLTTRSLKLVESTSFRPLQE